MKKLQYQSSVIGNKMRQFFAYEKLSFFYIVSSQSPCLACRLPNMLAKCATFLFYSLEVPGENVDVKTG